MLLVYLCLSARQRPPMLTNMFPFSKAEAFVCVDVNRFSQVNNHVLSPHFLAMIQSFLERLVALDIVRVRQPWSHNTAPHCSHYNTEKTNYGKYFINSKNATRLIRLAALRKDYFD